MLVQVRSIICGAELHLPLPHEVEDGLYHRLKAFAIFKIDDEFVVGEEITYLDMSEYLPDEEGRLMLRPLPKPGGTWKYVFGIFPTHEQAKGLFDMLESFLEEGISTFYPKYYNGETGEYNLPDNLDWELFKERHADAAG